MLIRTAIIILMLFSSSVMAYGSFGPVYEKGKRVNPNESFLSSKKADEKAVIINQHLGRPGCYILCIGPKGGLYPIGNTYDFHGLIRIQGHYNTNVATSNRSKRFCYPDNIPGSQASFFTYFKQTCDKAFSSCHKNCNGNGDTGSFFTNTPVR